MWLWASPVSIRSSLRRRATEHPVVVAELLSGRQSRTSTVINFRSSPRALALVLALVMKRTCTRAYLCAATTLRTAWEEVAAEPVQESLPGAMVPGEAEVLDGLPTERAAISRLSTKSGLVQAEVMVARQYPHYRHMAAEDIRASTWTTEAMAVLAAVVAAAPAFPGQAEGVASQVAPVARQCREPSRSPAAAEVAPIVRREVHATSPWEPIRQGILKAS